MKLFHCESFNVHISPPHISRFQRTNSPKFPILHLWNVCCFCLLSFYRAPLWQKPHAPELCTFANVVVEGRCNFSEPPHLHVSPTYINQPKSNHVRLWRRKVLPTINKCRTIANTQQVFRISFKNFDGWKSIVLICWGAYKRLCPRICFLHPFQCIWKLHDIAETDWIDENLCSDLLLIISRFHARQRHISLSDPSGARRSVKQGSVGFWHGGSYLNSYPASGFPKPKTQKPCFTSSRHFICKDFQCIFCAGTVAKKHLCTVAEYLSQRNLALGKYLHQQCNSREINNKSSNKIAEIIPVNRKCINIRPVLEKGKKNQPQQGSPTIFTPPEPFQRWHIHHFQFCCSYLGRGCCFRNVEISGKPRASQTERLGMERPLHLLHPR